MLYTEVKTVGDCNNDILISVSDDAGPASAAATPTSGSCPAPPRPLAGGFFGDYTGLAADKVAYPAWSDTRTPGPVPCPGSGTPGHPPRLCVTPATNAPYNNDQEIYVAAVEIPSG